MGDASWFPLYDLYATSEDGKPSTSVSLHYRVNLQQRTGEDWNDAKLILSTSATDMLDAGVPASDSLTIRPEEKAKPQLQSQRDALRRMAMEFLSSPPKIYYIPAVLPDPSQPLVQPGLAALPPLVQTASVVSKSPMAVNYTVDEYTTISSNYLSHKVLVAIIPLEATITHMTSPRKSPIAYLQVGIHPSVRLGISHEPHLLVRSQEYE